MKKILALACLSLAVISCTDDDIRTEHQINSGQKVVGFVPTASSVNYFEDIGDVEHSFPLSLIGTNGETLASDITVSYEVDASSTAVEGVEYDLIDTSGTIVIPAGATYGEFPLTVHTGSFDPLQKTTLVLKLTGADNNSVAGEQFKTLTISFVGCKSNIVTGALGSTDSFTCVITRNDGASVTRTSEILTLVDVNYFKTSTTGTWAAGTIAPDQGYNFEDVCGDITVPLQNLAQAYYSNEVYGLTDDGTDGSVTDFSTGDEFEIEYEITFSAGNRTYINEYTRN